MIDDPLDAVPSKTHDPDPADYANNTRFPGDWETGDAPMTEAQEAWMRRLCAAAGVPFDPGLTQAGAAELADRIRPAVPGLAATDGKPVG